MRSLYLFIFIIIISILTPDLFAKNIYCKKGRRTTRVTLKNGDIFKFNTAGRRYQKKIRCTGIYQIGEDCVGGNISCSTFLTVSRSGCRGGDILLIKDSNANSRKFCGSTGPANLKPEGNFIMKFFSDKRRNAAGLRCSISCAGPPPASPSCGVDLDGLTGKYPPLLLQNNQFIFPTSKNNEDKRILDFVEGAELQLYCHGSTRYQDSTYLSAIGLPEEKSAVLICKNGAFYYGNSQINVESVTCNRRQEPRLLKSNEECSPVGVDGRTNGLEDLFLVQIGWQIHDSFIEQIRLCHDEKEFGTIWTNHTLRGASIEFRDIDSSRPSFRIDNSYLKRFYTWSTSTNMNRYYSKEEQEKTVIALLGHNEINGKPLIETSTSGTNYFAKGHLSPDAAFVYNIQQDATYYFMNVAPQFQSFNNGNWKALEMNTRDLASKLARDITVYTGTHGSVMYPDINNNPVAIDLYNEEGNKFIPAPKYYWKVLHDPITNSAAAFIGLNDPHATEKPEELCTNVCSNMPWVDWSITELDAGYMYCCSVEDAIKAIPSMPDIQATKLIQLPSETVNPSTATCTAGPCNCTCTPDSSGKYTCTCSCA